MVFSTSAIEGFRLERIPDDDIAVLLQIPRGEAAARRDALLAQHRDPAWVASTLDALPAATLVVLHVVIDAGGIALVDTVEQRAREHFGLAKDDCRHALAPAFLKLLVVPLTASNGASAVAIVQPAAALVAPLVQDLALAALPAEMFVPHAPGPRDARMFLAVCMATRHLDVKLTTEHRPHRGTVKRLAKQVGLDETSVEAMLMIGLDVGLLVPQGPEGDVLRPHEEALVEAAQGRYPGNAALAASQELLAAGPLPTRALLRSLLHRDGMAFPTMVGVASFGSLPGFATGRIGETEVVAVRAVDGSAAAHITPSFEVFLPPESRLLDVVRLGACCEWERLDRAIVGRISKASIARAAVAGASAAQLLERLAAACRHPVPQNVEAAIRDWAGAVSTATIANGHVVVVEPGVRAQVAATLTALAARELAPGVFLVAGEAPLRAITVALAQAGVYHRELPVDRWDRDLPEIAPPASSPLPAGAARARARVAAWRGGQPFEGKRDDFLERCRAKFAAAPVAGDGAVDQLARWETKHGVRLDRDDAAYHAIVAVLAKLPPAEVGRIFATSRDLAQLVRLATERGSGRGARRVRRRPPPLMWQAEDVRARVQQAATRREALALQLAGGIRYVAVDQALRRGKTWMVLGDDLSTGDSVALPLDDVEAIAALPDRLDDYDLDGGAAPEPTPQRRWQPAPGEAAPAGHLPCPCGSGERYRHCCRDVPRA